MRVAIFGSGPSGLIAAHAAHTSGISQRDVEIFSSGDPSSLYGCQYLHKPIPNLSDEDDFVDVSYQMLGSSAMYQKKVYAEQVVSSVSVDYLDKNHKAWDIRAAYGALWEVWRDRIQAGMLDTNQIISDSFIKWISSYDVVVSTIPRNIWCNKNHTFSVAEIWAMGDAPELGIKTPFRVSENNSVVCNGLHDVGWYRMSRVFDYNTIEWPGRRKPPIEGVVKVHKPTSTDCECWFGTNVEFMGRYGEWKKGVLAHDVYERALKLFANATA